MLPDDVELTSGEVGDARATALSTLVVISESVVPLLVVTADGNLLQSTGRPGQWGGFIPVIAGVVGQPLPADAIDASLPTDGIVLATGDGHVWLATHIPNNLLSKWQDLELSSAGLTDVGTFATVAAKSTPQGLHILGTTTDGHLWHQLRPSPSAVFRDVEAVGVGWDVGSFTAVDCG